LEGDVPPQLIELLISVAVTDLPKLVTFFRSLGSQPDLTPEQRVAYQKTADDILDGVIAWAQKPSDPTRP
jgi:hypothetical protein